MQHSSAMKTVNWQGIDNPNRWSSATVQFSEDSLTAHGESFTDEYELTWQLTTFGNWVTDRLEVRVVGLGSNRSSLNRALFLQRSQGGVWSSRTVRSETENGLELRSPGLVEAASLLGALDCDLGLCPLTNTMPIRRLGLQNKSVTAAPEQELLMAWVEVPSLRVIASRQAYSKVDHQGGRIQYRSIGTDFISQLEVDGDGLVLSYPGLAIQPDRFAVGA